MVNNCTNTIKMNNYHLPQIFNKKKEIDNGNTGLGLGQTQTCGRVKLVNLMGCKTFPS